MSKGAQKVARRYAGALISMTELEALDSTRDTLNCLAKSWSDSSELQSALANPGVSTAQRRAVIDDLVERAQTLTGLGASNHNLRNFLQLIVENQRLSALPAVATEFTEMVDQIRKLLRIEIVSSSAVQSAEREALSERLRNDFGAMLSLTWSEDSELLGGAIIRAGDRQIDGSVRGMLEKARAQLLA